MQEFWGLILVICLAIIGGCTAVPVNNMDDSNANERLLERALFEQNAFKIPKYHLFSALAGLPRSNFLMDTDLPSDPINSNIGTGPNVHQKRQMRYHQDAEVGIVKEEIIEENAKLPLFKGRVVAWLVPSSDGTNLSDRSNSHSNGLCSNNSNLINQAMNNKYSNNRNGVRSCDLSDCDTTETESMMSNKRERRFGGHKNHHFNHHCCNESIGMASDIDSTTFVDTDDESYYHCPNRKYDDEDDYENDLDECDNLSHFSTTSEETSISKVAQNRLKKKKRFLHLAKMQARATSVASLSNSSDSLDIIPVTLNLTKGSFLGISIYGQCYANGDNGIYVGSIMDNGVVQQDGRIDVGDMILQVNDVNFENLSNDDAVAVLKKAVSKLGPITLVVAKNRWLRSLDEFKPKEDTLNLKDQPVRPIDPIAWVEHTRQINRNSKDTTNLPEIDMNNIQLTVNMEMLSIARAMSAPDSGLEIKDRTWLKITFSNAFLGSDVVNWLYSYVQGFKSRKEAKKYAVKMLANGYIKHTLNKSSFSEQCYYTFSDLVVFIPTMENEDSNDKTEINFENANPSKFLPWAQNTVSYGVFESCPSMQENGNSNQKSNFHTQSIASSDQLSQTSGPIHIPQYQQQMRVQPQQQMFYSNQQQQAQTLLHHPPFAPQPSTSNQASNFFNQFESNHLRAASSNSSETQSSLNTLSTRDTAIDRAISNSLMTGKNMTNTNLSHNALQNLSNGLSNLMSTNGVTTSGLSSTNHLSNMTNQHDHHPMNGLTNNQHNSIQHNSYNMPKVHLNNHPSLISGSSFVQN